MFKNMVKRHIGNFPEFITNGTIMWHEYYNVIICIWLNLLSDADENDISLWINSKTGWWHTLRNINTGFCVTESPAQVEIWSIIFRVKATKIIIFRLHRNLYLEEQFVYHYHALKPQRIESLLSNQEDRNREKT